MVLVFVQEFAAQEAFIALIAMWFGTYQTLLMKWPAMFGPADVFGMFYGLLLALPGLGIFLLMPIMLSLQPTDKAHFMVPSEVFGVIAGIVSVLCAALLYTRSFGLPSRPPRNCFGD